MFRTVPLFVIRSFSLYTQQWYMSATRKLYVSFLLTRVQISAINFCKQHFKCLPTQHVMTLVSTIKEILVQTKNDVLKRSQVVKQQKDAFGMLHLQEASDGCSSTTLLNLKWPLIQWVKFL